MDLIAELTKVWDEIDNPITEVKHFEEELDKAAELASQIARKCDLIIQRRNF